MTDQTPKTSDDAPKKKASAKKAAPAKKSDAARKAAPESSAPGASTAAKPATRPASGGGRNTAAVIILFVLVLLLAAGGFYLFNTSKQTLAQFETRQSGVLDQARQSGQQAQQQADQALKVVSAQEDTLNEQAGQITALKEALADTQAQLQDLNQAYQRLTDRGSDLVLLNDVENLVTIAQQQLQLSGNVANAIMSLETAQAQLARASRPALASLLQTINGDLERLRAARIIDVAGVAAKLDELADLVTRAPLLIPDDAAPQIESGLAAESDPAIEASTEEATRDSVTDTPPTDKASASWWQRGLHQSKLWAERALGVLRDDIDRFVSVRRVDDATALFISPDQASQFRDHLRLRVMTAQMALIIGRTSIWEAETTALQQAMEGRFDEQSALARKAIRIAREMADTEIDVTLPTVDNSIEALETLRQSDMDADAADGTDGDSDDAVE